jgi:hypothetical protein
MRTDLRTDMTKLIVAFRNFANAPKNKGGRNRVKNLLEKSEIHAHLPSHTPTHPQKHIKIHTHKPKLLSVRTISKYQKINK